MDDSSVISLDPMMRREVDDIATRGTRFADVDSTGSRTTKAVVGGESDMTDDVGRILGYQTDHLELP
jgi:hypothetical protein